MIITVKNLQQQTFTVNLEAEKTVLQLKEKIFSERGHDYIVEKQKLIYAGVILEDSRTLASYNVDEKKFIVVLVKRDMSGSSKKCFEPNSTAAPTIASSAASSTASSTAASIAPEESKKSSLPAASQSSNEGKDNIKNQSIKADAGNAGTESTTSDNPVPVSGRVDSDSSGIIRNTSENLARVLSTTLLQSRAESNLLMGEEYNRSVESMIEMGYCRDLVERAMAASFNNPERAVEYLISGIPHISEGFQAQPEHGGQPEIAPPNIEMPPVEIGDNVIPMDSDPFDFLRNQPQFLQMRSLIYQNPDLLPAVLQQIGQTNPALLQLISENQDAFLSMLNSDGTDEQLSNESQFAQRISSPSRRVQLAAATRAAGNSQGENVRPSVLGIPESEHAGVGTGLEGPRTERMEVSSSLPTRPVLEAPAAQGVADLRTDENTALSLSAGDREAIDRLKALGFPEALVLQAYFACEKDEQLAANFLISSMCDD